MGTLLPYLIIGAILIVLGILNMKGNISSLHRYHRHRVSEENRVPFGRLVGLGTILCGLAIAVGGALMLVSMVLSSAVMLAGIVVGLALIVCAMFKYNGGIF